MPSWAASRRTRSNSWRSSKARAPAIHWTTRLPGGACPPWTRPIATPSICPATGRFKVTESEYLAWAKRGQKLPAGELTLILADGSEFPSKGRAADTLNQVDPKTGTLELQASFPNPRHTLLPGQFGRIRVQ